MSACSDAPPPQPATTADQSINSGIDTNALDQTIDPCDNFYAYACGSWLKNTTIPADRSGWARGFSTIAQNNENLLHTKLDELAAGKLQSTDPARKGNFDRLAKFWATCNAEEAIEANAKAGLDALLAPIGTVKAGNDLAKLVAKQHLGIGGGFFSFSQTQDLKDSTLVTGEIHQAGIALPDRDYYFPKDDKGKAILIAYEQHIEKMFELAGDTPDKAKKETKAALEVEKALAKASLDRVSMRDPSKLYHRLELAGVEKAAPKFAWKVYLAELGVGGVTQINVTHPEFVKAFNEVVAKTSLETLKSYLRWTVIHDASPLLSNAFVTESFTFFSKTLMGTPEMKPRWRRCLETAEETLGEAVTTLYIDVSFSPEAKERTRKLIADVEVAMDKDIDTLAWMDAETKVEAKKKLAAISNMIGHPDQLRDYSAIEIGDTHLTNVANAARFEHLRQLAKIGKPVARDEWLMNAHQVNAYYNPALNQIVFPAGILQPPFYSTAAPNPVNYGAIGLVMGHEITHGFDDSGRQFDGTGNLRDWWTKKSGDEYLARTKCVEKQYSEYTAIDEVKVNGELTLGENIADLGGIKLAYAAHLATRGAPSTIGKFSDEQLFFLGHAQAWCSLRRPETARTYAKVDSHSPPEHRVNGPVSNMPEFAKAFACQPGKAMVRTEQCSVW